MNERQQLIENAQRLVKVLGEWIPACHERTLAQADRLLTGEISRSKDGEAWGSADFSCLDWSCRSAPNAYSAARMLTQFGLLAPLAAAYRHTGDERYTRCARQYLEAYLRDCPVGNDWQPADYDGPTSFPHRIGSQQHAGWLGALPAFLGSAAFDGNFLTTVIEASRHQMAFMFTHVYPGRNIRILHGMVLLLNGLRLSFLPESADWRTLGVRILNDATARQLLPDGADIEGSPEYHGDVLYVIVQAWKLAQGYPELGLRIPTEKVAAMFDYTLAVTRPDGAETALNDSSYLPAQGRFTPRLHAVRREFLAVAGLPERMPDLCQHFPDVGQVFLRDSWEPEATYLTFDATTRHGYHWHPSRNTVQLYAHGRALLVDPGYQAFNNEYGTRTAHHSTLNVNGLDQSHAPARAQHRHANGYDLVAGFYSGGYWPKGTNERHGSGVFGEHHRTLLWIHHRCAVVLDHMFTMPQQNEELTIESSWQFSEGEAHLGDDRRSAVTDHADSNLLLLFPLVLDGTDIAMHTGEEAPIMRGWVPSPAVRTTCRPPWCDCQRGVRENHGKATWPPCWSPLPAQNFRKSRRVHYRRVWSFPTALQAASISPGRMAHATLSSGPAAWKKPSTASMVSIPTLLSSTCNSARMAASCRD